MKINRFKRSQKTLTFFKTNFNYHEPFQLLIDATFCQAALQNKVIVEEQLKKYFQTDIKLLTTQCIIVEAESLGGPLTGATMIVKRFYVHKCGHEGNPIPASDCIKSMVKASRYIVATQDRNLQHTLRKVPGRALLYLHKATPVLEEPSDASKKYVRKISNRLLPANVEEQITNLKKAHGILQPATVSPVIRKKKGPKNPNPLSCKKKKPRNPIPSKSSLGKIKDKAIDHKKKRVKVAKHVKKILIESTKSH